MICNNCGKEMSDQVKFCQACGAPMPVPVTPQKAKPAIGQSAPAQAAHGKKLSKTAIVLIVVAACLVLTLGLFKTDIQVFAYDKLADMNAGSNIDKAIVYAEKANALDSDNKKVAKLYVKKAESIIDENPKLAIEFLLKASNYSMDDSLTNLMAKAYLKDAESLLTVDADAALQRIEESTAYGNSTQTQEMYAKVYLAKAEKAAFTDLNQAIEYAKNALQYKQSDDTKKKIIDLYLKKAEMELVTDPASAISYANEAKLYGNDSRIDDLIQKASSQQRAAMASYLGYGSESEQISNLIMNYTRGMADAVNTGQFSYIEPYLVYGSNLYTMQKDFVERSYKNGVKEEFINAYVKSYEYDAANNVYSVYSYEEYKITYSSGKVEAKGFDWVYKVRLQPEYGLMDISK